MWEVPPCRGMEGWAGLAQPAPLMDLEPALAPSAPWTIRRGGTRADSHLCARLGRTLLPALCPFATAALPCPENCHVTFVSLKCDSSKKRRRGRKSPSKEAAHITAEFEVETKAEEISGG